jgi:hypothetical protein
MCSVSRFVESRNPVADQDVGLLIGIVAALAGDLYSRDADPRTTEKYAKRFANAGLLSFDSEGRLPSAGKVVLALEDLIQRLRYAQGEYDELPLPLPDFVAHVVELPSEEAARNCRDALPSGQVRDAEIRYHSEKGWLLFAFYPDLPPDPSFHERVAVLQHTAATYRGRYSGSQR